MQTLAQIKALLTETGLTPRYALGQNFLIDHNLIRKLVDAAELTPGDVVLEIGPGTGTMTEELLSRDVKVIAAELDRGLSELLRTRFASYGERFVLIEGDCLASKRELAPEIARVLGEGPFKLVSNLPYAAATPAMSILLGDYPRCGGIFVTIQLEVAQRLMASHATKDYGPLSILSQCVADLELIAKLPPECFWPRPKVHSAMLAMRRKPKPVCENPKGMALFAQQLFTQRRKQLGAVLGRNQAWPAGITPEVRVEDLDIPGWITLFNALGHLKP